MTTIETLSYEETRVNELKALLETADGLDRTEIEGEIWLLEEEKMRSIYDELCQAPALNERCFNITCDNVIAATSSEGYSLLEPTAGFTRW